MIAALVLCLWTAAPELPESLERLIVTAPRPEDLPEADAVYLRHEREFQADHDGRVTVTLTQTVKVLRASGRRLRVVNLPWTTPYQSVTLVAARTILPDLRVVDVTDVAMEPVLPGRYGELLGELLLRRLQFPYVEPGACLDYQVTITDRRPSMPDHLADWFRMQLTEPVQHARYTVRAPAEVRLQQHLRGALAPPLVTRQGEWQETTWQAADLPGLGDEPQRPADEALGLGVLVSSARTWPEAVRRYRELAESQYVANTELHDALTAAARGQADPVRALYQMVAGRIRYAFGPLERGLPGLQPRLAYETYKRQIGDCKDQATLLITCLREIGKRAWPALVRRPVIGPVVESVPALIQFDHVVVAVPEPGGRWRWLDPTWSHGPVDYLPQDIQGARALVLGPGDECRWATIPAMPATGNVLTRDGELRLTADGGLSGTVAVSAVGGFEQSLRYRFAGMAPEAARREVELGLNEVLPGSRLTGPVDLSALASPDRPCEFSYQFGAGGYALRTRQLVLVRAAVFELAEMPAGLVASGRRYGVRLAAAPERTVNRLRFVLPRELKVRELPAEQAVERGLGGFRIRCRQAGEVVEYLREVELRQAEIPAGEVERAREFFAALIEADRQLLVLERRDGP